MKMNTGEHKRVFGLFIAFSLWVLFIIGSLVRIQVFNYSENVNHIKRQSNRIYDMNSKRGTIYDRNGEVLAISIKAHSAHLSNKDNIASLELFRRIQNKIYFTKKETLQIEKRIRKGEKFIWLKRKLSETEYNAMNAIQSTNRSVSVIGFTDEFRRIYPQGHIASHILGGVGIDEQGLYGIEYSQNEIISGKAGQARVTLDARRKIFSLNYITEPIPGKDIYLTIDSAIQFFVERELKATVDSYNARGGTAIVMDSRDSSILAMASYPDFQPAQVQYTPRNVIKNKAISLLYHPGSTFKIIVGSTALEENICTPQYEFNCCNGDYRIRDLHITDVHPYSTLTFEGVIIHSSNIGAARIGEKLGKEKLFGGIKNFGFGTRMGLDLPNEEKGIVNPINRWSGVSLAFLSHGYEIAVTPMQMARAYNVLASGGYLTQPSIIYKIDGVTAKPKNRERILSFSTVQQMVAIMTEVVNSGTAKQTRIEGMTIAGKTGTTKIINRDKSQRKYIASFGGFFPSDNPRITIFIVIEEPEGLYYGGDVAVPMFRAIVEKLSFYLRIFPEDNPQSEINI